MQKKIFTLFWHEAARYPWRLGLSLIGAVFTVIVASFAGPYIISIILGSIQEGGTLTVEGSVNLLLLYLLTQIYGEVIGWRLNLYFAWSFQIRAQKNIHVKVFEHLMHQSTKFHANTFGGSLVSQTNKLSGAFERFWDNIIFDLLPSITSVFAAVAILSFVLWQYAAFIAVMSICFVLVVYFGSRFMQKLNIAESQASTKQTGSLADAMANILAIKSHGQEAFETQKYQDASEQWRARSEKTMWGFLKISTAYASLTAMLNTGAVVAALVAVQYTNISVAAIYLCISYTFTVARQLWEMNNIMRNYNRIIGDAHDMINILDSKPEIKNTKNSQAVKFSRGEIVFNNVSFGYDDDGKQKPLFEDLNLHIQPGEKVGLVGLSGGGKTTITKLLLRFMDITKGEILIDGQDIAKLNQSEFRKHIAYVPQEPLLFHRTLKENIGYGSKTPEDAKILSAAKMAHAHEFIEALPQKYETLVGERGVKLSGGQRQRVAIARAMLKEAPILLLDEATSALDSESESLIQDALWKLMENKTAIVIAHRLSTIQKMDRILVLDQGRIIEEGSHTDLLRNNGTYAKLWAHQSGGFIEE